MGDLQMISAVAREGYTGQTPLGNMRLDYMNGRVEDASTGRFLSADPYITEPGNTQNYNRYSYVYNNPMKYVDPTGFSTETYNLNNGCTSTTNYSWVIAGSTYLNSPYGSGYISISVAQSIIREMSLASQTFQVCRRQLISLVVATILSNVLRWLRYAIKTKIKIAKIASRRMRTMF